MYLRLLEITLGLLLHFPLGFHEFVAYFRAPRLDSRAFFELLFDFIHDSARFYSKYNEFNNTTP